MRGFNFETGKMKNVSAGLKVRGRLGLLRSALGLVGFGIWVGAGVSNAGMPNVANSQNAEQV